MGNTQDIELKNKNPIQSYGERNTLNIPNQTGRIKILENRLIENTSERRTCRNHQITCRNMTCINRPEK